MRITVHKYWFVLCNAVLLSGFHAPVTGNEGHDFLEGKQSDLEEIANESINIAAKNCDWLATCNNTMNCSRDACSLEGMEKEGCMPVVNNRFCRAYGATDKTCKSMNFDYGRSYVRVANTTNLKVADTRLAICANRGLDPLFKTLTNSTVTRLSRAYLATMDGSFRIYPGTPYEVNDYDPRNRPWFRTATSVIKIVVVLIDMRVSMNAQLPATFGVEGKSIFEVARGMVKELLTTLSSLDYVNVILYNNSTVQSLSDKPIPVQVDNQSKLANMSFMNSELDNNTVVEGQSEQSDLSAAIIAALPNFQVNPKAAKVIVVLTDGSSTSLGENVSLPVAELSKVKLFLYELRKRNDIIDDSLQTNNMLVQQLCSVGGHFELISQNVENPLLAFQHYFSYLANLNQMVTNGSPQYTEVYPEATFNLNIVTVFKPVFRRDSGNLIGVAGITIFMDALGTIYSQVREDLAYRTTNYSLPPNIVLTNANCSIVTNNTLHPCGDNAALGFDNGGLCEKDPSKLSYKDLICCGSCKAPPSTPKMIVRILVPVGVVLVALVLVVVIFRRRICRPKARPDVLDIPVFPGPDPDDK